MKITAKARYALRILMDIGAHGDGSVRTIREIGASQGISDKFISRIVVPLRRNGLIVTARGVKGGLSLGRFPANITLLDIVESMDGPLTLVHCLSRPGACRRHGACAAEAAWLDVNNALADALRSVTLEKVIAEDRRLSSSSSDAPEYCI